MHNPQVEIAYTNYKDLLKIYKIQPLHIGFGRNDYHVDPQWILEAVIVESGEHRSFAMKDIHTWRAVK